MINIDKDINEDKLKLFSLTELYDRNTYKIDLAQFDKLFKKACGEKVLNLQLKAKKSWRELEK